MKRKTAIICILSLILSVFSGCCLKHEWTAATCEAPETCASCGKTQGEPLGHSWIAATCEAPETCSVCAGTRGEPLGHSWTAATCETPETCSVCAKTQGEPLGHTQLPTMLLAAGASYELVGPCDTCGEELRVLTDDWNAASKEIVLGEWHVSVDGVRTEEFVVLREDGTGTYTTGGTVMEITWATGFDAAMEGRENDPEREEIFKILKAPLGMDDPENNSLICQYVVYLDGYPLTLLHFSGEGGNPVLHLETKGVMVR